MTVREYLISIDATEHHCMDSGYRTEFTIYDEDVEKTQKKMKTYIISYDLKNSWKNKDYMPFYNAIKAINNDNPWQHFAESSWLIRTDLTAKEIFDRLLPEIGTENFIFISEINTDNNAGWLGKPTWEWLKGTDNNKK